MAGCGHALELHVSDSAAGELAEYRCVEPWVETRSRVTVWLSASHTYPDGSSGSEQFVGCAVSDTGPNEPFGRLNDALPDGVVMDVCGSATFGVPVTVAPPAYAISAVLEAVAPAAVTCRVSPFCAVEKDELIVAAPVASVIAEGETGVNVPPAEFAAINVAVAPA